MNNLPEKLNPVSHPIEGLISIGIETIVLVNFTNENEDEQNIYRLNEDGRIVWRVWSSLKLEGGYFTKIWEKDGSILSSNYDGFIRLIDRETGEATPLKYLK